MPLDTQTQATITAKAAQVARAYHRSHPWLSEAELASEAWLAALEALPRFTPEAGDLGAYLYRTMMRACKKLAWRLSVAANVPERSATPQLIGQLRAAQSGEESLAVLPEEEVGADEALDAAHRQAVVAQVVAEHLAAGRDGEAVRAVLYGEAKSAEAAAAAGVPVQQVYWATARVKKALAADARLQELL